MVNAETRLNNEQSFQDADETLCVPRSGNILNESFRWIVDKLEKIATYVIRNISFGTEKVITTSHVLRAPASVCLNPDKYKP